MTPHSTHIEVPEKSTTAVLKELAEAAGSDDVAWYPKDQLDVWLSPSAGYDESDGGFIAACDPQTILKLLAVVEAASKVANAGFGGDGVTDDDWLALDHALNQVGA